MSVLVNAEKVTRAQEILDLVTGKRSPQNENEQERKQNFTALLAADNIDPKGKESLEYVYVKLGGLVRTDSEHRAHEARARKAKSSKKIED